MAEELTASHPSPKRRRWLRLLGWICGVGVILLVVLYFVATSSAFLKSVILPQVGKAMNASVTVDSISVSPFSSVEIHNLKVQPNGREPLLTVQELRLHYSLLAMMSGKIKVSEVTVVSPAITLVEEADGTSNIDALASGKNEPGESKPAAKSSKPLQIDIAKIAVTDLLFGTIKKHTNGTSDVAEVSRLNLEITNVKNGQAGKFVLGADVKVENNPPTGGSGRLHAKLTSNLEFVLTDDLAPASFKGGTRFEVAEAGGSLADFSKLLVSLDAEATADEVKQIALRFERDGKALGEVRASGPFKLLKNEGHLDVDMRSIDKQILNLAGARSGMDFGPTTINSSNRFSFFKAGSEVQVTGGISVSKFQVSRAGRATPSVDATVAYDLAIRTGDGNVTITNLTLTATQKRNRLLSGKLTNPMAIAWVSGRGLGIGDSAWTLLLTDLNLEDWKALTGEAGPAGMVNATLNLTSQEEGENIGVEMTTRLDNLSVAVGSNSVMQVAVDFKLQAQAQHFSEFSLDSCRLQVLNREQPLVSVTASGKSSSTAQTADLEFRVQTMLGHLIQALQSPDLTASSGTFDLSGRVTQKQDDNTLTATLKLADLTGKLGGSDLQAFGVNADLDIGMAGQSVQIRKFAGGLTQDGKSGGRFSVGGKCNAATGATDLNLLLEDINQDGLRPFIDPALGGKKLASLAINGKASIQSSRPGDAAIKADLRVTNLVVHDPMAGTPMSPLEAKLQVDASLRRHVADLDKFQLTLSPTARAKNELDLTGSVDLSQSKAITGNLKLSAESLDFTPYYDLLTAGTKSNTTSTATAPPAPKSKEEPAALELPLRNFSFNVDIGRLYLREIDVAKFLMGVKIDGGHVVVDPFQLALNGAPVNAKVDLDLGVPGYKYDVSLSATQVPQAPLINSLEPDRKGQINGTCTLDASIKGAGVTGANLKKNLDANFNVVSTNLNLAIPNVRNPYIFTVINVIIALPELINGTFGGKQGWLDEFMSKPVDLLEVHGSTSDGALVLKQTVVQGVNFQAAAAGKIQLADVLDDSTLSIPIEVLFGYQSADGLGLIPRQTPTNTLYIKLPQFLTMKGTIGAPKEDINRLALAKLAGKAVGGVGKNVGKAVGTTGSSVGNSIFNWGKHIVVPTKTNAPANPP